MNNNKINLLPNSKHFDNNDKTQKHKNTKIQKEDFPMHIPDEEDEPNTSEQISQSNNINKKTEDVEESAKEGIKPKEHKKVKNSFFSKFFSKK